MLYGRDDRNDAIGMITKGSDSTFAHSEHKLGSKGAGGGGKAEHVTMQSALEPTSDVANAQ